MIEKYLAPMLGLKNITSKGMSYDSNSCSSYQRFIKSKEGDLTWTVKKIGKANEGVIDVKI